MPQAKGLAADPKGQKCCSSSPDGLPGWQPMTPVWTITLLGAQDPSSLPSLTFPLQLPNLALYLSLQG